MNNKKLLIYGILVISLIGILFASYFRFFYSSWKFIENRPVKILYLNSYHSEFEWSSEQLEGFKGYLNSNKIDYDMQVFHLDTKRKTSEEEKQAAAEEAIKFIEEFNPDLIYATDDNAQKYVGMHYLNSNIPWVFSGVNAEPEEYNYNEAENVAGLLERELYLEGIDFLKTINPSISNLGVISDTSETAILIKNYLNFSLSNNHEYEIEIIEWHATEDFDDYKNKILEYNKKADALILLPIYTIKNKEGAVLPPEDIIKWTVENSKIPEITSSKINVAYGALLSIETSGYTIGYEAGRIAAQILINGITPRHIGIYLLSTGKKYINYARAQDLELRIPSDILISSEVFETFPWD